MGNTTVDKDFDNIVGNAIAKININELLKAEKRRRGFNENDLVFIGVADTASFYWCNQKSLFSNREMEAAFFASYLYDRLLYSLELGYIKKVPTRINELLTIGEEITLNDLEKLLEKRSEKLDLKPPRYVILTDKVFDRKTIVISPSLSSDEKIEVEKIALKENLKILKLDDLPPKFRGELCEVFLAERYPTIRWNFEWDIFVIVGVPDGLSSEFVYEFKTTGSEFLLAYLEPCALVQGDLYGYFFRRSFKRVQIYVIEEQNMYTWHEPTNSSKAVELLDAFKELYLQGKASPPESWKCRNCEFRKRCAMKH